MKHTVKFDLFPQKSDCRPIRARVSYGGNRVDLRVGYGIEPKKWDSENMRVLAGYKNKYKQSGNEINKAILLCSERIEEIFARFELLEKRAPTAQELKKAFDMEFSGKSAALKSCGFWDIYAEFMEAAGKKNCWTKATYTKFSSLREHLQNFNPKLSFETLSDETLQGFVTSLHKSDLRNTTISKYVSFLRWFLRWAWSKGYHATTLHETFRPKLKGTDGNAKEVIYLEWEELMNLYSFTFPVRENSLSAIRDVFCFCCFTGLRYSDVAKLRRSDVKENHITVVTQKTVDGLIIELNKYSKAILKKYENVRLPDDLALPVISNQRMNSYLKDVGSLVGMNSPQRIVYFKGGTRYEDVFPKSALLTTHCGRRTFIVNALRLGVPSEVIMKWTGHSDFKAMKPYVKIVDKLKASEMDKFNTFTVSENAP
ncbi:MAG: site-specific integrase [Prevotellaceae bacterium]|jgi:integrase|nr:site-specific integrase [Prevotellaceae bacterium]